MAQAESATRRLSDQAFLTMRNPASKQLDLFADVPPAVAGKPKDPRLDEALLLREVANSRQEVI